MNPYEVLGVARDASLTEIEDAYDALFDEYEPLAQDGDAAAIGMLNDLNAARDMLVDPRRRAQVDAGLARPAPKPQKQVTPAPTARPKPPAPKPQVKSSAQEQRAQGGQRSDAQGRAGAGTPIKTRRRASYVVPMEAPRRNWLTYLPYFAVIVVLGFAIAVGASFLANKGSCVPDDLPTGPTVATVNGAPIYQRDLDEREAIDKSGALSDPLFSSFFDPNTITGTRALDSLKFNSLDKLINMEIIKQQAQKEGIWPTGDQETTLVQQAAAADEQAGETYEQMLCRIQVSDAKYRRTVIENVIYTVMASEHMPTDGTDDERTDGFIKWICDTRQDYNVNIMMTFIVTNNPSCTSGLPSDLPLPGLGQTPVPEPEATGEVPAQPAATPPAPEETVEP